MHAHERQQSRLLKHDSDTLEKRGRALGALIKNASRGRHDNAFDDFDQRCFSGPVRTQQSIADAVGDRQAQMVYRSDGPVAFGDINCFEYGSFAHRSVFKISRRKWLDPADYGVRQRWRGVWKQALLLT